MMKKTILIMVLVCIMIVSYACAFYITEPMYPEEDIEATVIKVEDLQDIIVAEGGQYKAEVVIGPGLNIGG